MFRIYAEKINQFCQPKESIMHLLLQTNDPSEIRQFSGANHEIMESFPHSSDAAGIEIWGSDLSDPLNFVEVRLVGNSGNLIHSRQVLDC